MKKKNLFLVICLIFIGVSGVFQSIKAEAALIGDNYPAKWKNAIQDSQIDDWGLYNRECTSFVANRLSKVNKFTIPRAFWNANVWANNARSKGYTVIILRR